MMEPSAPAPGSAPAFDEDTAVRPGAEGTWVAEVSGRWDIGGNPNGGYLLSVALSALRASGVRPDPLSITGHFLSPPAKGPAEVVVRRLKTGRLVDTVEAELRQGTRTHLRVIAGLGDLDSFTGPTHRVVEPPHLPAPELCPPVPEGKGPGGGPRPEIFRRFDLRLCPTPGWMGGEPSGTHRLEGWIRFADGRAADVASLPLFADGFPPPVLDLAEARWVPTLELTVHVRARPAPGWLRGRFATRALIDGVLEEDGELFDEEGALVAQSRQLAVLLPVVE